MEKTSQYQLNQWDAGDRILREDFNRDNANVEAGLVALGQQITAEETARAILDGVNPAKWICVQADDLDAAVSGDLVLFVMIGSQFDLPAADLIGAFKTLCGGTLDKELSK